jgi:hypothetical protein
MLAGAEPRLKQDLAMKDASPSLMYYRRPAAGEAWSTEQAITKAIAL